MIQTICDLCKQPLELNAAILANGVWVHPACAKAMPPKMRTDIWTTDQGDIVFQWPGNISQEDWQLVSAWLDLMSRKIGRTAARNDALGKPKVRETQ